MGTSKMNRRSNKAFSLIEVMIAIMIVSALSAIAVPAFRKFIFDARESEGTSLLLSAWKAERLYKATNEQGYFTEDIRKLGFAVSGKPKFNVITGNFITADPGAIFSLDQLGIVSQPKVNKFGISTDASELPTKFLIGAEAVFDQDRLHVLAIDENGSLFKICDAWTQTQNSSIYTSYSKGDTPICTLGGSPDPGDPGNEEED